MLQTIGTSLIGIEEHATTMLHSSSKIATVKHLLNHGDHRLSSVRVSKNTSSVDGGGGGGGGGGGNAEAGKATGVETARLAAEAEAKAKAAAEQVEAARLAAEANTWRAWAWSWLPPLVTK